MAKETDDDIIREAQERFKSSQDADDEQRDMVRCDIAFAFEPGKQWEPAALEVRKNRPCMEFNRVEPAIDQIVGDQRQTKPAIKIIPVEDSDRDRADLLTGMIRNVEAQSDFETVVDQQFEAAVSGGFGAWRIVPKYTSDESFDQELTVQGYWDAASELWFDPAAREWHKQDGMYQLAVTWLSVDEYKRRWPKSEPSGGWDNSRNVSTHWQRGKLVAVAEYWRKVPYTRTLLAIKREDGSTVTRWKDEVNLILKSIGEVVNEREVETHRIEWFRLSGFDVLEGPVETKSTYFPNVPVFGKRRIVDGRETYKGVTRNAKDSQRSFNYTRSAAIEAGALTPKTPWLLTSTMIKGLVGNWKRVVNENLPFLTFNADPEMPGAFPQRQATPQIPAEHLALAQMDAQDIRATTGIHESGLGMDGGPEQSGIALSKRQTEGDVANFQYIDNLAKSITLTGRILVDMIPAYYDTERTIRILGEDGAEKFVTINAQDEESVDIARGRYDVRVEVGPAYTTQRQEASERLAELLPNLPILQELALDLYFKNSDFAGANEIYERVRKRMVAAGVVEPQEGEQAPQQGPSEQDMLMLQAMVANIEAMSADTEKTKVETQKLAAQIGQIVADMQKTRADTVLSVQAQAHEQGMQRAMAEQQNILRLALGR